MSEHYDHRGTPPDADPHAGCRYVQLPPRGQYREAMGRRKSIIFGSAILGLIAALALGLLISIGTLVLPFGDEFSRDIQYAEPGDTPCPTEGARPQGPDDVRLTVLNTTSTPGLAGAVADFFEQQGYWITTTGNAPLNRGGVVIEVGPRGVDAAYTLARYLGTDVRIKLALIEDKSITIIIGDKFKGVPSASEAAEIEESTFALIPMAGCLPVEEPKGGWGLPTHFQSGQSGDLGQSGQSGQSQ